MQSLMKSFAAFQLGKEDTFHLQVHYFTFCLFSAHIYMLSTFNLAGEASAQKNIAFFRKKSSISMAFA